MKRLVLGLGVAALTLGMTGAALAQDGAMPEGVLAMGLNNPRHIAYGADGMLYVAEAGTGGSVTVQGPFGPAGAGGSSAVSMIMDGTITPIITSLPSVDAGGEVTGTSGLLYAADLWWFTTSGEPSAQPFAEAVYALDSSGRVVYSIDTYGAEAAQNPDGGDIDSNPVDLAYDASSATLYIADAGCNCVWSWTDSGGVQLFKTWDTNPVPTSVEVGADGSVWIGFLSGFPFPSGGTTVEQYSAEGELQETYTGFTTIVDLLAANDTVYAVEIGQFDMNAGWTPGTGRVVDVLSGDVLADGLLFPYGLAQAPEGTDMGLVVTSSSAYTGAGTGVVSTLDAAPSVASMMMEQMAAPASGTEEAPVETPEAGS